VKRRQVLKQLLQTSGGLIGATLLSGCQSGRAIEPLFMLNLLNSQAPLPDHILTPLSEFYIQTYAIAPFVNANQWRLKITGAVTNPITIALEEILNAPQEDFYLTMECIGNPTGGNLIGNALWTGTPLLPFLEKAGVKAEAIEFSLHGADFYETTLPIAEVMRPEVRLVHRMNGEPLTQAHGYPVRIIIPGHFGQKQPKWLTNIEAITNQKRGFWEKQGWSNTAEIPTHSLIRQVQETRVWNKRHRATINRKGEQGWENGVLIAGVALDKSSPIDAISLSTDNGKTWQKADQNQPESPHEWTLWRYRWQPTQPGKYSLLARAQSQREQQPLKDDNGKDGSSGVLTIDVTLQA
jgi:DMSO/TMAO reductase YedYZ molybdopterin-dependent catalytic subunit